MRVAFFHKMAPRGAHPPDAKFLSVPPPTITYCDVTTLSKIDLLNPSSSKITDSTSVINNSPSTQPMTLSSPVSTSTQKESKISSSLSNSSTLQTAPVSNSPHTSSTEAFHTVLRKKKNNSRYFKFSPKNYYHNSKKLSSTDSSKQSVFTKFSQFIEEEEEPHLMSEETPNAAVPVSPEKDTTMKATSTCDQMSPEEEQALLEEFDPSTQEPPPKLSKTRRGASIDLTNNSEPQSQGTAGKNPHQSTIRATATNNKSPNKSFTPNEAPQPPIVPNGTNIGMFTSTQEQVHHETPSVQKAPTIASQNAISGKVPVNQVKKNFITCRFKLHIKGNSCNLPHLAKQVTKLFRSADSSLHILPFNGGKDNNMVLDTEENLPHDEEKIKTWVVKSQIVQDRLHFSMKFSSIKDIPALSKRVFPWMKANRSYVKMDKIDSETISCLGLFEGLHPDFRNRGIFKQYCIQHIKKYNPTIQPEISIFPRGVYAGAGLEKVESRAVVIEVATEMADYVLQAMSHSFDGDYSSVTFVPFTKTDHSYSATLRQVMIHQNTMLHATKRKILHGLQNIDESFTMKDGTVMSLRNWLLSAKSQDESTTSPLIQHVDFTTNNSIAILFDSKNESILHTLLSAIDQELLKYFPTEVVSRVYVQPTTKEKQSNNFRVITESEKNWAEVIKRKYNANPQSGNNDMLLPPSKNRKVLYHGPSDPPETMQENSFDTVTPQADASIEKRLSQLENSFKNNLSSQKEVIQTTIQNSMQAVEAKMNVKTEEKFTVISHKIQDFEKKMSLIDRLSANVERLCSSLLPPASTTKDDMETSEGGNGQ